MKYAAVALSVLALFVGALNMVSISGHQDLFGAIIENLELGTEVRGKLVEAAEENFTISRLRDIKREREKEFYLAAIDGLQERLAELESNVAAEDSVFELIPSRELLGGGVVLTPMVMSK